MKKSSHYKATQVKPMKIKTDKPKKQTYNQLLRRAEQEHPEYQFIRGG